MTSSGRNEAAQAGTLLVGRIASQIAEAVAPLVVTRLLGRAELGAFTTVMLLYSTAATCLTAGFPQAALYFLAGAKPAERRAIVGRMTRINVLLGLGLAAVLGLAGTALPAVMPGGTLSAGVAEALPYLTLLAPYAVLDLPSRMLPNVLVAETRARASAVLSVVRSLTALLATLVPAALGYGVGGIVLGQLAVGVTHVALLAIVLRDLYGGVPAGGTAPPSRDILAFAFPVGLTDIVSMLNASLDLWIVATMFPAERVAEYKIGAWQIPVVTSLAYTTGAVYLPRFRELFLEGHKLEALDLWRSTTAKTSLLVVPLGMVFVVGADDFIGAAFPPEYAAAGAVFRCYSLLTMARVTAFGNMMLAAGKPTHVLSSAAFTLASNFVVSVPLALALGFVGPAIGAVVAFVPTVWFYCHFIARAYDAPLRRTFALGAFTRVVLACAPAAAVAWLVRPLLPAVPALRFAVAAAIVLVGFAAVGTRARLITREDWRFAADWVRLRML